ncbi:S41 family peptidase [Maricaulis salignorans]|uniref:Peptidase family S41 n=1 Tax=Maricaulis salignorans TaxID=144026 RepID=A0A1G9SFK5_9PROT|nr:S41 family peptidase [Maricaulis salignorans]SDM34264.1 Peptidase family S41 [Maricaulis salignorans]
MNLPRASQILIRALGAAFAIGLAGCAVAQPAPGREPSFTADQLRIDLTAWQDWLRSTHPDLAHSADTAELDRQVEALGNSLTGQYSPLEAWMALSRLNPVYADAHTGLAIPSFPDADFPPVEIRDGHAWIGAAIAPESGLRPGERVVTVDGIDIDAMIANVLPHIRGETDSLRERILQLRFAEYLAFWSGRTRFNQIELQGIAGNRFSHSYTPQTDRPGEDGAAFSVEFRNHSAILSVRTFDLARFETFNTFLTDAFARIAARDSERLIIDIRENGGGARELSDRLLAYLTEDRYTPTSAITARIAPENIARIPGAELGQVVHLPFPQWVEPPAGLEYRFSGEIIVLIGPDTYSQGIVFANIVQDFQIGRIAGLPTEGAANQTGQVQRFTLPQTGFEARSPLYIFWRASGEASSSPVQPDILLPHAGEEQLTALLNMLGED